MKKRAIAAKKPIAKKQQFPLGWDEQRVRKVLEHYENQTKDEAVAEDEAAFDTNGQTVMIVPSDLVPEIRQLIFRSVGPGVFQPVTEN